MERSGEENSIGGVKPAKLSMKAAAIVSEKVRREENGVIAKIIITAGGENRK
jgi:hypothetical protein